MGPEGAMSVFTGAPSERDSSVIAVSPNAILFSDSLCFVSMVVSEVLWIREPTILSSVLLPCSLAFVCGHSLGVVCLTDATLVFGSLFAPRRPLSVCERIVWPLVGGICVPFPLGVKW